MCPRRLTKRPLGTMPTPLFWLAIEQIVEVGVTRLCPFINGDPFADSRMPSFVKGIADNYPTLKVTIYTNGLLATPECVEPILGAGNVDHLIFSIQGGTREHLKANTGLDWDVVWRNVDSALEIKRKLKSNTEISVTMCQFSKTIDDKGLLSDECAKRGVPCCFGCFSNFGGLIRDSVGEEITADMPRKICDRAMTHVYIYNNGDVGQCCFDLTGETIYGNIKQKRLVDIINGPRFVEMRKAHAALDIDAMPPICRKCNAPKFHG